jgi:predicted glycosyl hydrolase (DUF1957 family)
LPLIQRKEAIQQIKENEEILKYFFGSGLKLRGFFLPEMAYSPAIAKIIKQQGYEWIIVDEIAAQGKQQTIDPVGNYQDSNSGLKAVFRNRKFSAGYVPEIILNELATETIKHVITATDAELYGLHHKDFRNNLNKLLRYPGLTTKTVSEHIVSCKKLPLKTFKLKPCNWESTENELSNSIPFALWQNKKNPIHLKLWELAEIAQNLHHKYHKDTNWQWSRWHLVRGLESCTFWWSSEKDFKHVFGPVAWNPDEVDKGVNELIRSIRSLENSTSLDEKLKAERLNVELKKIIWERHWKKYRQTK